MHLLNTSLQLCGLDNHHLPQCVTGTWRPAFCGSTEEVVPVIRDIPFRYRFVAETLYIEPV